MQFSVRVRPRTLDVYYLTTAELHELASVGVSLHLMFFGVSAGAAVALVIALLTATLDTRTNAVFVALLAVSLLGVAYFSVRAVLDWRARDRVVRSVTDAERRAN
ncbi:MAG: hypothetical protein OXG95_02305 [Chloroflexi bacterium]|nr:hypothetical protein [Chloroflexota bacterium]